MTAIHRKAPKIFPGEGLSRKGPGSIHASRAPSAPSLGTIKPMSSIETKRLEARSNAFNINKFGI
jgi:hypothetical protein